MKLLNFEEEEVTEFYPDNFIESNTNFFGSDFAKVGSIKEWFSEDSYRYLF